MDLTYCSNKQFDSQEKAADRCKNRWTTGTGRNGNQLEVRRLERIDELAVLTTRQCGRKLVEVAGINTEGVIGD